MSTEAYNQRAQEYTDAYESVETTDVHEDWLSLLPDTRLLVLDIGAGSGRLSSSRTFSMRRVRPFCRCRIGSRLSWM